MTQTRNNLISIIIVGIVTAGLSIGSISLMSFRNVVQNDNRQVLEYACRQNAETINTRLLETEVLVHTLSDYYLQMLRDTMDLKDEDALNQYVIVYQ